MSQRKPSNKNYTSCKIFITGYRTSRKKRYNLKNKHRKTLKCNLYFCENPGASGGFAPLVPPPGRCPGPAGDLGGPQTPRLTKNIGLVTALVCRIGQRLENRNAKFSKRVSK